MTNQPRTPILIYIPGVKALTPELTQQHNLDALFPRRSFREVLSGPSGQGIIVSSGETSLELITYDVAKQRWSPRFGCNSMVGTWSDLPTPTPEDLAKPKQLPGPKIELLDGTLWTVPLLRSWYESDGPVYGIRLPRVTQQDPVTGCLVPGRVVATYAQLWERSLKLFDSLVAGGGDAKPGQLSDQEAQLFALELLQINYWLDTSVISHLGLLTSEHCGRIIHLAFDIAGFEGCLKNLLSRSPSSGTNTACGN